MTQHSNSAATGLKSTVQTAPAQRNILLFAGMASLLVIVGLLQSWNVAFSILNMCLISAIMALGVNIQWGYAGLFNVGVMGFAALGGLAGVVISMPPVDAAWAAGGLGVVMGLATGAKLGPVALCGDCGNCCDGLYFDAVAGRPVYCGDRSG